MDTVTKVCCRCNRELATDQFYKRPYSNSVTSECRDCMRQRSKERIQPSNKDYQVPFVESEKMTLQYLSAHHIPALPGKTLRQSHVDVFAFGCIGIEVKYSKLDFTDGKTKFKFVTTPSQQIHGFRASIVCLICDYGDEITYHFFRASDPVFYMGDRLKTAFTFTPGAYEALKHGDNRVVMVQGMMDEAQDNTELIWETFRAYCDNLS